MRLADGIGLQNEVCEPSPERLTKRKCYGIIPRNCWSLHKMPLQDGKTKKKVGFRRAKRVHIKSQNLDFDGRFCTF